MKSKSNLIRIITALISMIAFNAYADTINIADNLPNNEIQALLEGVTDGCTINFANDGIYNNINLIIKPKTDGTRLSNITINGNNAELTGTPIAGTHTNGILTIQGVDGFTLQGFSFFADGVITATQESPSNLVITDTSNGVIKNNSFQGGRYGIYLSNYVAKNSNTTVESNNISEVTDSGIISFGSPNSLIKNNVVTLAGNHGIDIRNGVGANATVQGNHISNASECIYLQHSRGHTVTGNTLSNCSAAGITCYGVTDVTCDENHFSGMVKIGFLLEGGYKNVIIGENNNYNGLVFYPYPPTFATYIAKGDSAYVSARSGTFSDANSQTHEWDAGVVTKEPTHTETGTKLYTCSCGSHTFEMELPKLSPLPNTLAVKGKNITVKSKTIAKKSLVLTVDKVINFINEGQGALSYKKTSGSNKIVINQTTGSVTIKKGLKAGIYKVGVEVRSSGTEEYLKSDDIAVTFKINIK